MRAVWIIGGLAVAAAVLDDGVTGKAMANSPQGYDALIAFTPGGGEETTLLQMSDLQLDSITGGQVGVPMQMLGVPSDDLITRQVTQIINEVVAGQNGSQSVSNTIESSTPVQPGGEKVAAQQTQTGTQGNGPQPGVIPLPPNQSNHQINSLQQGSPVSITTQSNGTTKVVVQQGARATTIIIPFPVSSHTLLNAIPFQALVTVGQDVVHAIQQLSSPMIGTPATILRGHR